MKNWIKQILRESLNEVKPIPKPEFGSGFFHTVYSSRKHPDRLYKIGDEEIVNEWVSTFKENPKYFPKVYRVFPYSKKPYLKVVEIEKLNTGIAKVEFDKIDKFLIDISSDVNCNGKFITILDFFEYPCFEKIITAAQATNNPQIIPLLYKWGKFISAVKKIVDKDLGRDIDLHRGNVAYDNEGNLKMIDI
jgi:hypothetical protein